MDSYDWSAEIPAAEGSETRIEIQSAAQGKKTAIYTVKIYRSALVYDYRSETVIYDMTQYRLTDQAQSLIRSGDSIAPYIKETGESVLFLQKGEETFYEVLPNRPTAYASAIDYRSERTTALYGSWNWYSTSPDMTDPQLCQNDYLYLTPGINLYIQKYATDTSFASAVTELAVPARPAMPPDPGIDFKAETTRSRIADGLFYCHSADFSEALSAEPRQQVPRNQPCRPMRLPKYPHPPYRHSQQQPPRHRLPRRLSQPLIQEMTHR